MIGFLSLVPILGSGDEEMSLCVSLFTVPFLLLSGGRDLAVALRLGAVLSRATLGQSALNLGHKLFAHLLTWRLVEPIQEPAASGRLSETLIDLEARAGEKLLDLSDGFQSIPLPAAEAERTGGLDRPILHALQWRRRCRRTLEQASVIVFQRPLKRFQPRGR